MAGLSHGIGDVLIVKREKKGTILLTLLWLLKQCGRARIQVVYL